MKEKAVAEWKAAEERRLAAERQAQEERDKEFKDRLKREFGYGETELQGILTKTKGPSEEEEKKKKEEDEEKKEKERRTTWIKVCSTLTFPLHLNWNKI